MRQPEEPRERFLDRLLGGVRGQAETATERPQLDRSGTVQRLHVEFTVRPGQILSAINGCGDPHTCTTLGDLAAFTRSSSFARDALTW